MCVLGSLGSRQDVSHVFILVPLSDEDGTLTWEYLLLITALGKTNYLRFFFLVNLHFSQFRESKPL